MEEGDGNAVNFKKHHNAQVAGGAPSLAATPCKPLAVCRCPATRARPPTWAREKKDMNRAPTAMPSLASGAMMLPWVGREWVVLCEVDG